MVADLRRFGGKPLTNNDGTKLGAITGWNFGWVPPEDRTEEETAAHVAAIAEMPTFRIAGHRGEDPDLVALWHCSLAANGGKHFITFAQETGSCVGNGLGQAIWYLSAVEVIRLGDPEQVLLPFYLLPYGRSRYYAGMRGRGEGSIGSAAAKAARVDGILPYNMEGLPPPTISEEEGITWGRQAELEWSNGGAIADKWLQMSRKHLVRATAQCRSADECWEALSNYYPLTVASDWGGQMKPQIVSDPPVLLNKRTTTWQHQMCVISRWKHPELGRLFYVLNSWGPNTHGVCPSGAPPGGFWITEKDMDYIARQGDTFAFSQFNGFPAQEFSWRI